MNLLTSSAPVYNILQVDRKHYYSNSKNWLRACMGFPTANEIASNVWISDMIDVSVDQWESWYHFANVTVP